MANVKENAALKSRQTKLLKKSKEELIEVILRKDKIEKNQVKQISNLKGEINSLNSRIKGFVADNEGDQKTIKELRDNCSKLKDLNNTLHENIAFSNSKLEETTNKLNKIIVEKENKAKSWANIAITLGVAFVIAFIAYICK
jgi:TolA-binding protein